MIGEARTTGDDTMAPTLSATDGMFAVKDQASGEIAEASGDRLSASVGRLRSYDRQHLAPGLPPIEYRSPSRCRRSYQPGRTIRLAVAELVYEDPYLTSDEKGWDNGLFGFRFDLPVRVLPPDA